MVQRAQTSETQVTRTDKQGNCFEFRPISCPTCGPGTSAKMVGLRGGPHHRFGLGVETRIVRCVGCGLYYPDPFPFPVDAQKLYGDPAKYFKSHDTSAKVESGRRLVRELGQELGRQPVSLLDVGSGRGEMLAAATAEGIQRVVGLELSEAMIETAREQYGVEVFPELIETFAAKTSERFDIITLNAVLEHVYDPDAMIACCRRLLSPEGVLYIDVPNEEHLLAKVGAALNRIRKRPGVFVLAPTFPPYHVFGFSPPSLQVLLRKHGFEITDIRVHGSVTVRAPKTLKGRVVSFGGETLNRVGNLIGMGHNMFVKARFSPAGRPSPSPLQESAKSR